ncbi:hypothetical protein B2J93_1818 [Marssonina coronariae]|uniref:Uncharacterized protein n=1 Tax=Diplocarpon coronariae TaxID=2795749 RepID=A0A218ZDB0_9HELO|nr:hypothetical protein B2J93_1818 [Marssonina coronariae]
MILAIVVLQRLHKFFWDQPRHTLVVHVSFTFTKRLICATAAFAALMGVAYAATEETTGSHCIHRWSYCGEDAACSLVHRGLGGNPVASHGLRHDLPLAPVIKPPHPRFLLYGGVKPTQGPSCSIYVPATKQALAPIMVALHFCTGTGPGYFRNSRRHGTSDFLFPLAHLADTLGQWSSLLGVSLAQNIPDSPQANYTKIVYGNGTELVGYEARGVVHTLPLFANVELEFFGIV